MALQSQVYQQMAPAIEGMPGSVIESHYTAPTFIGTADITVGRFVFADATDADKIAPSGTGMVRGLAVFTRAYVGASNSPSMVIPKGQAVTVATNGKFWVRATNASPAVGHFVFASQTDGSVSTAAANTAQSGKTMTNFRVERVLGTEANSLILISNQTAAVTQEGAAGA